MSISGGLRAPALAGLGFVLGSQAGMISIAVTAHHGRVALVIRVIGLVIFSIGSVALINGGMLASGQRRSLRLGLGVGAALGAVLYWLLVPYEVAMALFG
jgi:hypothetical protein